VPENRSSAPHLTNASTHADVVSWGAQPDALAGHSQSSGRVIYKGPGGQPESGLWICTPGRWRLAIPRDELCYFVAGRADYQRDNGERVAIGPRTLVLFPAGWAGECTVHETLRNTYMLTAAASDAAGADAAASAATAAAAAASPAAPSLHDPLSQPNLVDWGLIPTMLEGASHTSGKLLYKGPQGRSESGIWRCTPGRWACHVTRDEYCHFLAGRSTYVHESGEVIEIRPDTLAYFPASWRGECTVHETVTKVYMIR
jgi:uncharacterized cupin superfamily protein